MTHARHQPPVHGLKDAALGPDCRIRRLAQDPAQGTVAFGCPVTLGYLSGFLPPRTDPTQDASWAAESKVAACGPTSAITCWAESTPKPGTAAKRMMAC